MCIGGRQGTSPLALKLAKITIVVIFCCFAECAAGSCLSYGHACWGGHGKRSGNSPVAGREDPPSSDLIPRWFLARLAADNANNKELASSADEFYADDALKGTGHEYRTLQEALSDEGFLLDDALALQRPLSRKIRAAGPSQTARAPLGLLPKPIKMRAIPGNTIQDGLNTRKMAGY